MKVAFVCSSFGGGGAEKVAVRLSSELSKRGHEVMYIYWKEKKGQEYAFSDKVIVERIEGASTVKKILSVKNIINEWRPDAILSFTDIPNIITFFACGLARHTCRRFPNVRTDVKEKYKNTRNSIKKMLLSKLHAMCCKKSDVVFVNSYNSALSLSDFYGIDKEKIKCIYNPVFESLDLGRQENNKSINSNDKIKAVTVGRLSESKNQKMLINALQYAVFELGIDLYLDIYGDGELKKELLNHACEKKVADRVSFKGFHKDVVSIISNYDVFLFSSRWEGLPNALIEAAGSGIPVISTDCPSGPREILKNGKFGMLVKVDDYVSMGEKIAEVANNRKDSDQDQERSGEEKVKHFQQFTVSYVVNKYMEFLVPNVT